jgi:hypothetical protein
VTPIAQSEVDPRQFEHAVFAPMSIPSNP